MSGAVLGEPLQVPIRAGGATSGAGSPDGAVMAFNPAGVSASGNQFLVELDGRAMSLSLYSTRHEGIDPNTNEIYLPSNSSEITAGGYLGATFSPNDSPLGYGLAIHTSGAHSVDFRGDEAGPNYQSHQRYGVLFSNMRTTLFTGAVGLPIIDNLHLGFSASAGFDSLEFVQAWDPLGFEGLGPGEDEPGLTNPYSNDVLFSITGNGSHMEFSGGLMWVSNRYSIGVSYWHSNTLNPKAKGSLVIPPLLGDVTIPILADAFVQLAPVVRVGVNGSPLDWVELSLNGEAALWEVCCSGKDGDMKMSVNDEHGNQIGPDQGVLSEIAIENYLALRLKNRFSLQGGVDFRVHERFNIQGEVEWRQPSVPDYAVNAMNLDFETLTLGGGIEGSLFGEIVLGLDFAEVLSIPRRITNSAWDVRVASLDDVDPDYVDERFSPQLPYTASGNGYYESEMRTFSVRIAGSY